MDPKTDNDVIAGPQAVAVSASADNDAAMTAETATRLQELCAETSEPFDGSLSEAQAQRRIAALRELHETD